MTTRWTDLRQFAGYGEHTVTGSLCQAQKMPDYDYGTTTFGEPERQVRPEGTVARFGKQLA
ncbi:hypothetical protein [Paracoccus tegillarcae]|uniref:Uncharacterized protein n=1 Tax=Paracoccus tegillarcae TaxID=1529068 RepID=A0A2K9ESA3_9RHOB|nr:hypothetical protein [Paracoccus tegillarcae]AUH32084.1 hypothetical protein CUV01_00515 [Paracoccus tegillarcae]